MGRISYGLEDRIVLVTGGSRGIGLETVRELLVQGARVAMCARRAEGLEAAVNELNAGERLFAVQAHIAREEEVERLFDAVLEHFGGLDVLINNVGMNLMTPFVAESEYSLWQKIIDTNLNGTYLCSRRAARIMKNGAGGRIVSISSIAGHKAAPGMGIYGIAKAAVEMMTRVLASELAPHNIRVNAVAPGMVRTDFSRPFWENAKLYAEIVRAIPMGRIAETLDVVQPVLFLASDAAGFITGQTIVVDGGASAV